jgi:hypothetical protein
MQALTKHIFARLSHTLTRAAIRHCTNLPKKIQESRSPCTNPDLTLRNVYQYAREGKLGVADVAGFIWLRTWPTHIPLLLAISGTMAYKDWQSQR